MKMELETFEEQAILYSAVCDAIAKREGRDDTFTDGEMKVLQKLKKKISGEVPYKVGRA